MRLALETTALAYAQHSGIARYANQLLLALAERGAEEGLEITRLCKLSRWRRRHHLPAAPGAKTRFWKDSLWPLHRPYDLVHATSELIPDWPQTVRVTTFHDVYPAVGMLDGEAHDVASDLSRRRRIAQLTHHAICVSEATRRDVIEHLGVAPERTHVVHLGVEDRFRPMRADAQQSTRESFSDGDPYLMFLSFCRPNKNLERLVEAYALSPARQSHRLLLVGSVSAPQREAMRARLRYLGILDRVRITGFVADGVLPALYSAADALLFPSLYEGFGLPILEAMACGTPVLTSTGGSCPEVAGGQAVIVDPLDVQAIAAGIGDTLAMTESRIEAALCYARSKTWKQTALNTLEVYRRALACA